jgi:acyl dehydratase
MSDPLRQGARLGPTPWLEVSQERIQLFGRASDDKGWVHMDPERAARGPYGSTIAHGFLTLQLSLRLLEDVLDGRMGGAVVYGVNRVRFPAPVPAGSRVRGNFEVLATEPNGAGTKATIAATIEREGGGRPVMVAELVLLFTE